MVYGTVLTVRVSVSNLMIVIKKEGLRPLLVFVWFWLALFFACFNVEYEIINFLLTPSGGSSV